METDRMNRSIKMSGIWIGNEWLASANHYLCEDQYSR